MFSGTAVATTIGTDIVASHHVDLIGVGATQRLSAVRWGVTQALVNACILTHPICAAISWAVVTCMRALG